jgi:GNAT superfamily N-acetyltransferase
MTSATGFIIRDGLEADIAACLSLDLSYETDTVWQVTIRQEVGLRQVMFRTERLPRPMQVEQPADEARLRRALSDSDCFLVAATRDPHTILGYLLMSRERSRSFALIRELGVSQPYRRRKIGTRLVRAAKTWAQENGLEQLMLETHTKNYPAIQFAQSCGLNFSGFNDQYFQNQDIAVFFSQSLR